MLVTILEICSYGSSVLWLSVALWLTPAFWRFAAGRQRFYDPLKSLLLLMIVNRLWYSSRQFVFGSHTDIMSDREIAYWAVCGLMSALCAVTAFFVLRSYDVMRRNGPA